MNVRTINYKDSNNSHEFTRSLRQTGFGILNNHPIDFNLIYDVYIEWEKFFNGKHKHKYLFDSVKQDGFFPLGTENAKGAVISDIKEFYHFYPWGRLPNDLSNNTKKLYKELVSLTSTLLHWIQDETPKHIKSLFSTPLPDMIIDSKTHLLRIIHYPPLDGTEEPEAIRGAAHEDINLITLLIGAEEGGLEVLNKDGSWIKVAPSSEAIVCNIGDMMQLVTDKQLKSTTHRVIQDKEAESKSRYSIPFFLHPAPSINLKSIFRDDDEGILADDFLDQRLKEIKLY